MVADRQTQTTRVVFLEPGGSQSHVLDPLKTIPMLGPLYLGTLSARAGYDVTILNEHVLGRSVRDHELADADILCLSCMTATVQRARALAKTYKSLRHCRGQASRTIMGGLHATVLPEDVVNDVDQVFVGEAESKILDLLAGKLTDRIVYGEPCDNLDDLPAPDIKLVKNWQKLEAVPVMTARGSQSDCHFCNAAGRINGHYRPRQADSVMDEIRHCGHRRLLFVDDHFAVDTERTSRLVAGIKGLDRKINWSCQLRPDVAADPVLVKNMREAGCRSVYVGFAPIRQHDLSTTKEDPALDQAERAVRVCRETGIRIHGTFVFGADADGQDTFKTTSDFCRKSGLASVQYQALTPLPGTPFYQQVEREGRLLHKNWQLYDALHVVFQPKQVTPVELQQGLMDCFSDFYSYTNAAHDALNTFFATMETLIKRAIHARAYYPSWIAPLLKLSGKRMVRQWIANNNAYLGYLHVMAQHADISHWYQFLCPWPAHKTSDENASRGHAQFDLFCNPLDRRQCSDDQKRNA